MIGMGASAGKRFKGAKGFNPYLAIADMARRNPRGALVLAALFATGFATFLLVALSSVQAFLVVSQQSSNNTQNRFSLTLNQPEASPEELALGDDGSVAFALSGGQETGPIDPAATSATPTGVVSADEVVSVRGIRVHHSIADDIEALLAAAEADGINLSGWGWRDNKTQIRLRRQHCGTTEYAIYRMPSSQCSPPTARPGRSQHEYGLAVDFTYNGGSISSHRSPGFKWLNANAGTYGLKNLASEPWHWSTTGR